MGNHEYCTECGLSSFHYGEPCPSEAYEKHQAEKKLAETRFQQACDAAKCLAKQLIKDGYKATIGEYGDVVISKWSLI